MLTSLMYARTGASKLWHWTETSAKKKRFRFTFLKIYVSLTSTLVQLHSITKKSIYTVVNYGRNEGGININFQDINGY
jgi:hypothetical protein